MFALPVYGIPTPLTASTYKSNVTPRHVYHDRDMVAFLHFEYRLGQATLHGRAEVCMRVPSVSHTCTSQTVNNVGEWLHSWDYAGLSALSSAERLVLHKSKQL